MSKRSSLSQGRHDLFWFEDDVAHWRLVEAGAVCIRQLLSVWVRGAYGTSLIHSRCLMSADVLI